MDTTEHELNDKILELCANHNHDEQFFKDVTSLLDKKKSHIMKRIKNNLRFNKLKKINNL